MEWQVMLMLHLVLVTLHGRFTINYRARQMELVTLNTIFSVVHGVTCFSWMDDSSSSYIRPYLLVP